MIKITGDRHGNFDDLAYFNKMGMLTSDDMLIILGDSGFNYYLDKRDIGRKFIVNNLGITVFCIHGNHEERPHLIKGYKRKKWHGGTVYYEPEYPNILFARDGDIYDFNGKSVLVIGGAYSVDKYWRLKTGNRWYKSEQPNNYIKQRVKKNLDAVDWKVDVVLSHTCPLRYEPTEWFLKAVDQKTVDKSTEKWLGVIERNLDYKKWYCGHYHGEKEIDKIEFLFNTIKPFMTGVEF